jgi:hypothetical protein
MRSKLRVSITMSLDGYVAGPDQNEENPLGVGGLELHQWFFPLKAFREMHGHDGGEVNVSNQVAQERLANVGATINGPQHVRAGQGLVAGRVLAGLVGRESPVPSSGVRAHSPPARATPDAGRYHLLLR